MDLSYGPEYDEFRDELRDFLAKHRDQAPKGQGIRSEPVKKWQKLLIEQGYTARTIPKDYGGFGAEPDIIKSRIIAEEFADARVNSADWAARASPCWFRHCSRLGTEEQKQHVRSVPRFTAEMVWCQGYSEPGAGSDLASLTHVSGARG